MLHSGTVQMCYFILSYTQKYL